MDMFHAKIRFALVQVLVSWPEQWPLNGDPSPNKAGSFVTLGGRWPIGFNPLPNGAGSFLTVEAQWPLTSKQGGVTWFRNSLFQKSQGTVVLASENVKANANIMRSSCSTQLQHACHGKHRSFPSLPRQAWDLP